MAVGDRHECGIQSDDRFATPDITLEKPLPPGVAESLDAYLGCVGGASVRGEYLETIEKAGFRDVRSRAVPTRAPYAHVLYTAE